MDGVHTDDEIVARILGGEVEAFALLFDRYERYLAKLLARYLSKTEIDDALIGVFTTVHQRLETYDARGPLRYWLATIAVRVAYRTLKAKKQRAEVYADDLTQSHEEWMDTVLAGTASEKFDEEHDKWMAAEVLRWALSKLSPEHRMVLSLVYFEDRSYKEAANMLGWSEINVRVRTLRARKALKSILKQRRSPYGEQ